MVPFPLSRSPHPSSGPFPTYRKPARPAPFGGAPHKGLQSCCGAPGFRGGGFLFCVPPPLPPVTTRFVFGARGLTWAARPPIPRRALFLFPLRCFARRRQKRRGGGAQAVHLKPAASIKKPDTVLLRIRYSIPNSYFPSRRSFLRQSSQIRYG